MERSRSPAAPAFGLAVADVNYALAPPFISQQQQRIWAMARPAKPAFARDNGFVAVLNACGCRSTMDPGRAGRF
jgi:hypothetical protein